MTEGKSKRTPRRLQLACEPCRVAKLKCDRILPVCEQCFKRSRESACKYTEKGMRYNASVQTAGSMKEKMQRLETLVDGLKAQQSNLRPILPIEAIRASNDLSTDVAGPLQTGRLEIGEGGSSQWIGPSTWQSLVEDVNLCAETSAECVVHTKQGAGVMVYAEQADYRETSEACIGDAVLIETKPTTNILFPTLSAPSQAEILESMPPRAEMDQFVAAWFNVMDPTRVIVHAPTFQTQYVRFWLDPAHVDSAWLALLLATSSLGAEISGQSLDDGAVLKKADHLRTLAAQTLTLANPAIPRPWLVECLIAYVTSLLFNQHDATPCIWQLIGLTMRLCHQAGYHRDPAGNPKLSVFECEMRRRVWMVACELDISISNTLGMVSSVDYRLCDTQPPSNLVETDFSPEHCTSPRPYEECTLVQVEICFARLVWVLGDIVVMSQTITSPSKTEIEAIREKLDQTRDQLPAMLKFKSLDQSFIDPPTEIIDRFRLEFAYQKAKCVLYRGFLGRIGCQSERRWCLEAAQTIVQHSIDLLRAAQPGGQLAALRILLIRHVHEFTLAALLICSQLKSSHSLDCGMMQDILASDIRSTLLQACRLWGTLKLRSSKTRSALSAILRHLDAQQTGVPNKQLPTPGEEFVSYLSLESGSSADNGTSVSVEPFADTYQSLLEEDQDVPGITFDALFGTSCSPFENVQTGWLWPDET